MILQKKGNLDALVYHGYEIVHVLLVERVCNDTLFFLSFAQRQEPAPRRRCNTLEALSKRGSEILGIHKCAQPRA